MKQECYKVFKSLKKKDNISMAYEDTKKDALRRKVLSGSYSKTVIDFLLYNKMLTQREKEEVLSIARQIAFNNGHGRVYWEDFTQALKIWREDKEVKIERKAV
jgi:hypothetical protein